MQGEIYSVRNVHYAWVSHQDVLVEDTFTFVLPDEPRKKNDGSLGLSERNLKMLRDHNRRLARHRFPAEEVISGELKPESVSGVSKETLETLSKVGITLSRKYI